MATSARCSEFTGQNKFAPAFDLENRDSKVVISIGDFCLDLRTHQATVRGQELGLTLEEFDLLAFILQHNKGIIAPYTLLHSQREPDRVQPKDWSRVFARLREKLAKLEGNTRHIRMEPWIVYRFDPGR